MSPQDRKGRNVAHQRAARAAARAAEQRKQRRTRVIVGGVIGAVVVLALVLAMLPDSGDGNDTAATTTSSTSAAPTTSVAPEEIGDVIPDDPGENTSPPFEYGTGECAPDEKPAERPTTFAAAPKSCLEDADYSAVVTTSQGTFTIDLLEHRSPGTVNNFVQLAKWGWFDGNTFHRVVKGFVDQTGDPVGNPPGTGGPGYTITDELPPAVQSYARGAIAMANSGPNTNGSQWFACVDCSILPTPGYSLFGQVTDGMEVVQAINDLAGPDDTTDPPVTITSVEIVEG
jgi:cyclophilin family peptidyl-prolyl cis-trans isomerase